ncbi:hypothetical protein R3P38DRAFT_3272237 [Favolaschia claudopus]|uniref:Uncharacterized protein n=1 Tax=Favolaschia claudopus TaxID=2862362 RepID=A0AAW0B4P5_9AGAR
MQFLATLFASLVAVAIANPLGDMAARDPAGGLHCDIIPFLNCTGGIDQQSACGDDWKCPGNGLHPIIANQTCATDCVCIIPCP